MKELVFKSNDGKPLTNSLLVAEKFGKRHSDVLRIINGMIANDKLCSLYLSGTYDDEQGKKRPMYIMGRDGFSFLVMGFTGEKAIDFKIDFINAFNKMEESLTAIANNQIKRANESAKRRWYLTTEKRRLDNNIANDMERRKEVVRELNKINVDDFQQLSLDIFDIDYNKLPGEFPAKSKLLKIC